jgi:uncharacterized lipoprotein
MKKLVYASVILFCAACSSNSEKSEKQETPASAETVADKTFACPMQCEGDKTYPQAGKCPVCKMDLREVAVAETDSTGHLN